MKHELGISDNLCEEAKDYMRELIAVMRDQDLLTSMDSAAVGLIGDVYDKYIRATKILQEEGYMLVTMRGDKRVHPMVKVQLDAQIQLTKLFDSFGLNPKARKEISKPKEREKDKSPIDSFLTQMKETR